MRASNFGTKGTGLRILTETVTSPTLGAQIKKLLAQFPEAKWHQYEPCGRRFGARRHAPGVRQAREPRLSLRASGRGRFARCRFPDCRVRDTCATRAISLRGAIWRREPSSKLNRLYVVESMPTSTGRDGRSSLAAARDRRGRFRAATGGGGGRFRAGRRDAAVERFRPIGSAPSAAILTQHRGSSLVIAGEHQPPFVHALAHAMNAALGNVGKTVVYTDSIEANPVNQIESLRDLVNDLNAGKVELLLILGANPVYDAPADFNFAAAILKAKTARPFRALQRRNRRALPLARAGHPLSGILERWRAYDGTVGIVQPLIAPLYDGHSAHEIVALADERCGQIRARPGSRLLAEPAPGEGQGFRGVLGNVAARWRDGRHGAAGDFRCRCAPISRSRRRAGCRRRRERAGSCVPSRSHDRRRRIREQRLAAGSAQADHAAHLGQRRDGQPGNRAAVGPHDRRLRDAAARRPRSKGGRFHRPGPRR